MKVNVVKKFKDKKNPDIIYLKGDILEVKNDERLKDLCDRGLCKEYKGNKEATSVLD